MPNTLRSTQPRRAGPVRRISQMLEESCPNRILLLFGDQENAYENICLFLIKVTYITVVVSLATYNIVSLSHAVTQS